MPPDTQNARMTPTPPEHWQIDAGDADTATPDIPPAPACAGGAELG
jgi:hypothetical protein